MTYAYPEIKSFKGLFLQANSFAVPDGALETANNVNISKDGILTSVRGFYNYFTPSTGTLNRLFNFNENLIAIYTNKMSYFADTGVSPNETGTETILSGSTVLVSAIVTSRSLQSNGNFYATTDNGPLKLTAYNSAIINSGAPQALDIFLRFLNGTSATWLLGGNIVAYRITFGYTDANGNLIIGAPSDIVSITNTSTVLNSASHPVSATGAVITVTSTAHGLAVGQYLSFSGGSLGTGSGTADPAGAKMNGIAQIATVADANTFTYTAPGGAPGNGTYDNLTYCYAMPVRLEASIPTDISTAQTWFYQVYRSSQQTIIVGVFDDFQLVQQTNLTSNQIIAGIFFFTDAVPDILRSANLYTNENSAEGEAQANYRPPYCLDMTFYKGYSLYANCITRQILYLNVVDSTVISAADFIETSVGATVRRYVARSGVGNQTVRATCSSSGGDLLITYTAHNFSNGDLLYVANQVGGSVANGYYYVVSVAANTLKISLTAGGTAILFNSETSVEIQGVTNGTYPIFYFDTSSTPSVRLANTSQAIIKAINRDASSVIYANYISGINGVPGQMQFQSKGFTAVIYVRANSTTSAAAFSPLLPTAFNSGTQVNSQNSTLPATFYVSKISEPEAVPLVNFFTVGSTSKSILRIVALRDSVIIIKQDGLFRMTGDVISNFTITILDSTVHCLSANSVDIINNQVCLLSNQGICLITESSVQIISRPIENVIQPILGQVNLSAQTIAVSYETERMYLLTTTQPNTTKSSVTYSYNLLTGAWTTRDELLAASVIGPNDIMYYISTGNKILRERKKQTRIDYTGQNYSCTLNTISSSGLTGTLTISGYTPKEGDILVKNSVVTWITSATLVSGTTYAITLYKSTNLAASDSLILYSAYTKTIKLSPFHGGLLGRLKHFAQMLIHLKDDNLSKAYIYFTNDTFSGSEITTWSAQFLLSSGWGNFQWGFQPWGQEAGINISSSTSPAPIIRIYIPKFAARSSFIQPYLEMRNGADILNIQGISFAVRAYGERETR